MELDGIGIYGMVTQYAMVFFLTLGALSFYLFAKIKGKVPKDESPKYEMLKED